MEVLVMILKENYILSNGIEIPKLGLGTWEISDKDVTQAIKEAVRIGYRHIDTAQGYQNESGVGNGIRSCDLKREEIFVTTKLDAGVKSYKDAVAYVDQSLKTLRLEYIDLMLIHSPKPWTKFHQSDPYFEGNRETWTALEEAYKAGKLRAIGISNFRRQTSTTS
jgi:diketogulonate reductase-like aldo/keto reductase